MTTRHRRTPTALAITVALTLATACGSTSSTTATSPTTGASSVTTTAASDTTTCTPDTVPTDPAKDAEITGTIRVLAAASLTESFGAIADAFHTAHPDAKVETSFGASSDLVAQVHAGAPADVLATADTDTMDTAVHNHDVDDPVTFTCNRMVILTAKNNPLHISSLADLARSDVRFVLCAAEVPCGHLGREVLTNAGVDAKPVGSEANVKAVVAKVTSGEVDAGIVYVTDAEAAAEAAGSVTIPAAVNVTTAYPIARVADTTKSDTAQAFIDFVRGPTGQKILASYGFGSD